VQAPGERFARQAIGQAVNSVLSCAFFPGEELMSTRSIAQSLRAAVLVLVAFLMLAPASAQTNPQKLVTDAQATLANFMRDPDQTWVHQNIGRAKALLIVPQIVKAGFIFGGSGGQGVLVARNGKSWVGPAFYDLATASVGFQAGVEVSEALIVVMTDKGLNSLLSNSFKMGADASVAAGPVGAGAQADVVTDLVTYSHAKGIYGGINLDGTVVAISDEWNEAYYGKKGIHAPDILVRGAVHAKGADRLASSVAHAAGKK